MMKNVSSLSSGPKKLLLLAAIFSSFFFTEVQSARADVWGAAMAASIFKQAQEELTLRLNGAILGALKQATVQVMNTQISMMVGGGNGKGPMFIANWQTFLVADPQRQASTYMNDFFSMTTHGRNTANYRQEGIAMGSQPGCVGRFCPGDTTNYDSYLVNGARSAMNSGLPNVDLMNYGSPTQIFSNWRTFSAGMSPNNYPASYTLKAQEAHAAYVAQEERKADVQAIAYNGFKAVEKNGTVQTPGYTVGQLVGDVQNLNLSAGFNTDNVAAFVSSMGSSFIGIAMTEGLNKVNNEIAGATGVNLGLSSLANVDWNNSGSGQSSDFNSGIDTFNTDASKGITSSNTTWGDMNFKGANVGSTNTSTQNSYTGLDASNFNFQSQ